MTEALAADGQARRNRGLVLAYASGFLGRGISVMAPLLVVPILLAALGEVRFGVWATVTSFTSMLVFADLGLGSGLLTRLSAAYGKEDLKLGRLIVSNSYWGIAAVAVAGVLLTIIVLAVVDVGSLLGVESAQDQQDARAIVAVVITVFFCSMPLSLIVRVQLGVQRVWQSNLWSALGPVVSIPLVWTLAQHGAGPAAVTAAAVVGPAVVLFLNNLAFFNTRLGRALRPSVRLVSGVGMYGLVRIGTAFAGLSVITSVALNIDNTLIALVLGSTEVTSFAIASRLFRSTALLLNIVAMPLWGANGEALARGDVEWVRRTTKLSAAGLVAMTAAIVGCLVVFRVPIVDTWVGPSVTAPLHLYVGFALWSVLVAFVSPFFMVQNAVGLVRIQIVGWGCYLVASVVLKLVALHTFGIQAVPWAGALAYAVTVVPSAIVGYRKVVGSG